MFSLKKKRILFFLIVLTALTAFAVSALGDQPYRLLRSGSYGDDVLAVKNRLYALGYFTNNTFNNRYTDDTVKRVKAFEAACGLPQTGVMSAALQALLFSDDAMRADGGNLSGGTPALAGGIAFLPVAGGAFACDGRDRGAGRNKRLLCAQAA